MSLPRVLFASWTGDNPMTPARKACFDSLCAAGVELVLVTGKNLHEFVPREEVHPAYAFLSAMHRADYLRCELMHRYGGGYSDIKHTHKSWLPAFDDLEASETAWVNGYQELSPDDVAKVGGSLEDDLRASFARLLGNGSIICKPGTPFTTEWRQELHRRLDGLLPALRERPARHHSDRPGMLIDFEPSEYPVPWTFVAGDIFHPLCLKYADRLLQTVPRFSMRAYF